MKNDLRFCSVCNKPLLKRDRYGFVLVVRCDQCNELIHDRCYLNHHLICHNLIGVVIESESEKGLTSFEMKWWYQLRIWDWTLQWLSKENTIFWKELKQLNSNQTSFPILVGLVCSLVIPSEKTKLFQKGKLKANSYVIYIE